MTQYRAKKDFFILGKAYYKKGDIVDLSASEIFNLDDLVEPVEAKKAAKKSAKKAEEQAPAKD